MTATARRSDIRSGPGTQVARSSGNTAVVEEHDGRAFGLLIAGYPLAWAVGLAPVHHLVMAVPMALWLIRHRPVRLPPGTVLFALFLAVVAASAVQLDTPGRIAIYALRSSWYLAALIGYVYLGRYRRRSSRPILVWSLVLLFALLVAGGYLSVLAPELDWSTPVAKLLPAGLGDNDLVDRLIRPQVSEIQLFRFRDVILYRPAAPFAYTNAWGSSLALLTPFVVAAIHDRRVGIPRFVLVPLVLSGLVPFAVGLNRGSWLTLAVGLGYGAVRYARTERTAVPVVALALAFGLGATVALSSGVLDSSAQQLAARSADSNETRATLYLETIEGAASSPIIGHGSTRPNPADPEGPPLGTHGQLWAVLFAHGFLGAGLYVGFFVAAFRRATANDPVPHWAKVSLLIGLLQLPIYGHLPHQLFIMVAAAAIATWPNSAEEATQR